MQVHRNPWLLTDSYKGSHAGQYPPGMTSMFSYFESRGGEFENCTLLGTQALIAEHLAEPFTLSDVDEAAKFFEAHGVYGFPHKEARNLAFMGYGTSHFPVRIRAVPEGTIVPTGNALMTVESTGTSPWVVNYLETLLSELWYPSTVGMISRHCKEVIKRYLDQTSDTPEADLPFKLHDFGFRGVSSVESAGLGGFAHLCNFLGSDTIQGVRVANFHYDCPMAGFSIPATEHSTVTSWGKINEYHMFAEYVRKFLVERQVPPGVPKLAACVSDSYDVFRACEYWTSPYIRNMLKSSGGTLIIRPDSGDPLFVLPKLFDILESQLDDVTVNQKGYKVLPPYFRMIQGDGINRHTLEDILALVTTHGWSASNIAFGSGGGLLQSCNRDTQKFAFKCSSVTINGEERDVFKSPITDPGKRSKTGRLDLIKVKGEFRTVHLAPGQLQHPDSVLVTVYNNGPTAYRTNMVEIRNRMEIK